MTNNIILSFQNVTYSYPGSDKIILKNINLELEQGKKYALIGPTGEGKSTTAMLMAGLVNPTIGTVNYQGKVISNYSREELASSIGFILQDPFLFAGTIADNLIYGSDLTKESLVQKLKDKNLDHLIYSFSEGLDTIVTNNSENISLGQKQIINFLRVILREPKFLILDEATANLDTITEKYLQEILNQLNSSITIVIIAHRLNTVKNVDVKFQVGGTRVEKIR